MVGLPEQLSSGPTTPFLLGEVQSGSFRCHQTPVNFRDQEVGAAQQKSTPRHHITVCSCPPAAIMTSTIGIPIKLLNEAEVLSLSVLPRHYFHS
jgi:hypothetical protein